MPSSSVGGGPHWDREIAGGRVHRGQVHRNRCQLAFALPLDPGDVEPAEQRQLALGGIDGPQPGALLAETDETLDDDLTIRRCRLHRWLVHLHRYPPSVDQHRIAACGQQRGDDMESGDSIESPRPEEHFARRVEDATDGDGVILDCGEVLPHRLEHHLEILWW